MPSAAPANVQSYASLLTRSRLLSAEDVKAALKRWQEAGKGGPDDVDGFRKYLVSTRQLTEYQAILVQRGHTEGFFLDAYKVLELIGKGRMAGVYKAVHPSGQVVAIKVLPPSKAKDPTALARFQREGRMLTKLDHPNVVRAFQVGESGGKHYFVMEHLEGETLDEVLQRRKRLPVLEAVRAAYQVLLGLQHVHEKGLVHRDVKPANLMLVSERGPGQADTTLHATLKVLDIGLGRAVFDENAPADGVDNVTTTGALLGTPDYLAPEQAQNARAADVRSDIYSVGCTLYHMLTGQVPFPDNNVVRQVLRHATETPRPLAEFVQPLPEGLDQVVSWMMAKNPAQRYPTPERAAQALQIFLMNHPEASAAPTPSAVHPAYLNWLHTAAPAEAPARGATVAATAAPAPAPAPVAPAAPAPERSIPVAKLEPPRKAERVPERPPEPARPREAPKARPAAPPTAAAAPVAASPVVADGFDVELVPIPSPDPTPDERGLLELNRRDWIMLGAGGGGVLFAILAGYGIAQLARRGVSQGDGDKKGNE